MKHQILIPFSVFLIYLSCSPKRKQIFEDVSYKLSSRIELPKDTLLLGEPAYVNFIIKNEHDELVYVQEGGDYRSGRKISFNVLLISPEGDTLQRPELWGAMGGRVWYHKLMPNEERAYKLFLPMWGKFEKEGKHIVSISKTFYFSHTQHPYYDAETPRHLYPPIERAYEQSVDTITLLRDDQLFGEFVDNLVEFIKVGTEGRVTGVNGYKINDKTTREISDSLSKSIRFLYYIEDERILPFAIEALKEGKYIGKSSVLDILHKFIGKPEVFDAFLYAAQGERNTKCTVFPDSIDLVWYGGDTRQYAVDDIIRFNNQAAVDFLIAKKNDEFPEERYNVLARAPHFMSTENARAIYLAYSTDKHNAVRTLAQELLKKMER